MFHNDPSPYREALSSAVLPRARSRTLVAATCAGVWIRTLSLLLSLDTVHNDDFDFLLAVTPRDDDTTVAYARAAGFDILEQGEAVRLPYQ